MGATAVVGAGLRIWAASWRRWFLLTLIMSGIVTVVVAGLDPWTATYGTDLWFEDPPFARPDPNGLAVALTLASAFFLAPWELVILTRAALRSTFEEPLRGRELIGRTIGSVHSILWIFLLLLAAFVPVAIVLGALLGDLGPDAAPIVAAVLLAVLVWIAPRLATLMQVFVGEDARGTRAIAGAWRLSRGHWGTSLGVVLLTGLIGVLIGLVPGLIVFEAFPAPSVGDAVTRAVVQSLAAAIVTPLGTAITAALYLELRARKGLEDQAVLRGKLARFDDR